MDESDGSFGKQINRPLVWFSYSKTQWPFLFGRSDILTYSRSMKQKGGISLWVKDR